MSDHCWLSRRRFLSSLGFGAAAGLLSDPARGDEGRVRTISIFHTTDLHGNVMPTNTYEGRGPVGGLARCAAQIRTWRRQCPDSLLLDIGDVYQGTAAGLQTRGRVMIDLFNTLRYDGWVLGNHDFDWGRDAVEDAVALSTMPVLCANLALSGRRMGTLAEGDALASVKPWIIREVGGFRIGIIGLVTPGLPYWLRPELLSGVHPLDPAEELKRAIREVKAGTVDAIVVTGHMGFTFREDFANPVRRVLEASAGNVDVYLGGHSHQHRPSWRLGGTLCTQANYFGIHCGRVDLTFDVETRRIIDKQAFTVLMDDRFTPDPVVVDQARPFLEEAAETLATPVGKMNETLSGSGRGSEVWDLICRAISSGLEKIGEPVEAVFHGTFGSGDLTSGEKTIGDLWKLIPYENRLVVAELTPAELALVIEEDRGVRLSDRALWGLEVMLKHRSVTHIARLGGDPLPAGKPLRVGFSSYDIQSAGQRLMKLREIAQRPEARIRMTRLDTRTAVIDHVADAFPL